MGDGMGWDGMGWDGGALGRVSPVHTYLRLLWSTWSTLLYFTLLYSTLPVDRVLVHIACLCRDYCFILLLYIYWFFGLFAANKRAKEIGNGRTDGRT